VQGSAGPGSIQSLLAGVAALCLSHVFQPCLAAEGEDLLRQFDRQILPESGEIFRKVVNIEPDGTRREFVLYTLKKGNERVANLFLAPARKEDTVMLRVGENMWLQRPGTIEPHRILSRDSVVQGIFDNWDLLRAGLAGDYVVDSIEEDSQGQVLSLHARTEWVAYPYIHIRLSPDSHQPISLEAFDHAGALAKAIRFKDVKDFGNGIVRPAVLEAESPRFPGHKALLVIGEIRPRELADEIFTKKNMQNLRDRR
jgi:hypothetical protein